MQTQWSTQQLIGAVAVTAVIAALAGMAFTREPAGADIVLPGSPLYNIAVTESIQGLAGQKEDPNAEATPCPDCGKVHAKQEVKSGNLAGAAAGVSTNYVYCENCQAYHPAPAQPADLDALVAPVAE